ncbi:MAG: hypothetical protein QOF61_2622 [Acidobacteriota bacterium]|nr:hypothetical protein [Acidobacteriota bacterium]
MDTELLEKMFGRIGARVRVAEASGRWNSRSGIDIRADARGEYYDIKVAPGDEVSYEVVDLRPEARHLLLMARRASSKQKFLCGHDERHWFVCAVPGASVASVRGAMEALQPGEVRARFQRRIRRVKNRLRRRNEVFVRQGEWFFIPAPEGFEVDPRMIFKNEPISRGRGSKPHMCEELHRRGGETVYVSNRRPAGVTEEEYRRLLNNTPAAAGWGWRMMRRGAEVYVRGRVWHADHKTVVLADWHRVLMNTEGEAAGASTVVFLD